LSLCNSLVPIPSFAQIHAERSEAQDRTVMTTQKRKERLRTLTLVRDAFHARAACAVSCCSLFQSNVQAVEAKKQELAKQVLEERKQHKVLITEQKQREIKRATEVKKLIKKQQTIGKEHRLRQLVSSPILPSNVLKPLFRRSTSARKLAKSSMLAFRRRRLAQRRARRRSKRWSRRSSG
jgi:hypothetical protein